MNLVINLEIPVNKFKKLKYRSLNCKKLRLKTKEFWTPDATEKWKNGRILETITFTALPGAWSASMLRFFDSSILTAAAT